MYRPKLGIGPEVTGVARDPRVRLGTRYRGDHMSIVDKVKEMLGSNADKASDAVDKAGDMVDEKTGGKYADKVDMAQDKAKSFIDSSKPSDQA